MKGAVARLDSALRADGVPCDVKEYPDAGHGFLNQFDGTIGVLVAVAGRLMGEGLPRTVGRRRPPADHRLLRPLPQGKLTVVVAMAAGAWRDRPLRGSRPGCRR